METRTYIGADIGGTSIKAGLVDGEGNVSGRIEIPYREAPGRGSVMDELSGGIADLMERAAASGKSVSGIGVSAAGCINSVEGKVAENGGNIPGWSRTDVTGTLRRQFDIPVSIANDANCAVLGELWTGAARGYSDVVGVTLGTGVGGGIVTGGRLLEGSRGFAGEIGHFPTHAGGETCICGLDGCYERYASTSSLMCRAAGENSYFRNGRMLFAAAAEGDEAALRLLDEWETEIAYGIAGLVHIFDPQLILIGGGVSAQQELLIEPLKRKVLELVMPDFADGLEFKAAALGNDAGMTGAVYYLLSRNEIDM